MYHACHRPKQWDTRFTPLRVIPITGCNTFDLPTIFDHFWRRITCLRPTLALQICAWIDLNWDWIVTGNSEHLGCQSELIRPCAVLKNILRLSLRAPIAPPGTRAGRTAIVKSTVGRPHCMHSLGMCKCVPPSSCDSLVLLWGSRVSI